MQDNDVRDDGDAVATAWWNQEPDWSTADSGARELPLPASKLAIAAVLAVLSLHVVPIVFGPIAWLYARRQRRLVETGVVAARGRRILIAAEIAGATVTTFVVVVIVAVLCLSA